MNAAPDVDNQWLKAIDDDQLPEGAAARISVSKHNGAIEMVLVKLGEDVFALCGNCPRCGMPFGPECLNVTGRALKCGCGGMTINLEAEQTSDAPVQPWWFPVMVVDEEIFVWAGRSDLPD